MGHFEISDLSWPGEDLQMFKGESHVKTDHECKRSRCVIFLFDLVSQTKIVEAPLIESRKPIPHWSRLRLLILLRIFQIVSDRLLGFLTSLSLINLKRNSLFHFGHMWKAVVLGFLLVSKHEGPPRRAPGPFLIVFWVYPHKRLQMNKRRIKNQSDGDDTQ